MKKYFVALSSLFLAVALAACGGSNTSAGAASGNGTDGLADGVYTAQMDDAATEASGHGWRDTLVVTVEHGAVTAAEFESYSAEGQKKSEADDYPMPIAPAEWQPQLAQNVVAAGAGGQVEAIAGATTASHHAQLLLNAILAEGKPGQTITVADPAL